MTKVVARSIHRTMREQHGVNETTVAAAVMPRALLAIPCSSSMETVKSTLTDTRVCNGWCDKHVYVVIDIHFGKLRDRPYYR